MKIYLGIKFYSDNRNKGFIEELSLHLEKQGHSISCVARDIEKWGENSLEPADLMERTFEMIRSCDLVLIELTEKGVGLGIESGYAHAMEKPIITIAKAGSDISTTLRGISSSVISYSTFNQIVISENRLDEIN